ncbi:tetracycline resistance protein [Rhizobium flavescens]|uniref:tetracycline resistance protein n=1 Tax=Rhizobium flavescens TaxID=2607407 RepID=UPI001F366947|nr:tetracycline resistance protein [Rhizobium flavescens]
MAGGAPALQSLVTGGVDDEHQGRMQGLLSSMASLASIVGPLAISTVYFASSDVFPGRVSVLGAACHLLCLSVALARPQVAGVQALDRRSG